MERKYDLYSDDFRARTYETFARMRADDPVLGGVATEIERRPTLAASTAEAEAMLLIALPHCRPFTLRAKADRIDRLAAGGLAILDYKTGGLPSMPQVLSGYAPQLPLEAAMARAGAFAGIDAATTEELAYWRLRGGRDIADIVRVPADPMTLAAAALDRLHRLIGAYEDPGMPYLPVPDPDFLPAFGRYDHLSRRSEWAVGPL